jgi:segregation and condensation protein B
MAEDIDTPEDIESIEDSTTAEEFNEEALLERFQAAAEEESEEEVPVGTSGEEAVIEFEAEGTELAAYESAEIEEEEFLEEDQIISVVESILFSTDRPVSLPTIKQAFKGTQVRTPHLRRALDSLAVEYAGGRRGITLEEVNGGYQLRTKVDNLNFLRQMIKIRPFKLSGPALEVLAIIAYKQPMIKSQVDEIRGVESGHLMRALMEKGLVNFAGKSDLPGKPMFYQTTRKFLEIFGLRNLKELPSLSEIDELIPEGIDEETAKKESLSDMTAQLSEQVGQSYSQGEEELMKISSELEEISTSSEFFEQEKARMKAKRESERAQDIRDALTVGEPVEEKDKKWLDRYEAKLADEAGEASLDAAAESADDSVGEVMTDLDQALVSFNEGEKPPSFDAEKYEEDLSVFEDAYEDEEPEAEPS